MSEPVTDANKLPEGAPDDPLTGHDYDGIQEYDNPLPGWWKWLFVASIVFTPPYLFWYHGGAEGRTLADQYDRALVPWNILAEREPTDAAVQEAMLAVPNAYANLSAHGRAAAATAC